MRTFFEVISRAKYFVHFTSWGISHVMIGALKMASMRVPVYGFVSDVAQSARVELTEFPSEAPKLTAKVIPSSQGIYDAPHQKILIIDGLVAFKGSTNLTNAGPRRADRQLDVAEVVTDFEQVTELNNRYFAQVWRSLTAPGETFVWSPLPF
jgi:phosphatidylserine/phosphatidylglycerophosphate/cardiolipin synthase-like enzyme